MMRQPVITIAVAGVLLLGCWSAAQAEAPATRVAEAQRELFDPARHMRVAEVRPGMKGYGLSVFAGTKIERFEVEVISILRNFSPKQDVVLIRAAGCNLEHTGAIAGMSGSPIYLKDDSGKFRLIGAFAFGWPMMKDPLAGVQPIEYMLSIPLYEDAGVRGIDVVDAGSSTPRTGDGAGATGTLAQWSVSDSMARARQELTTGRASLLPAIRQTDIAGATLSSADVTRLRPLQTPLMTSGLSDALMQRISPVFSPLGAVLLQAGGSAGEPAGAAAQPAGVRGADGVAAANPRIEPGSVLAVPLITGDVEMTAVGTCTEVLGDRIYGFGHPFTGEGPVRLPMGAGSIQGIIANLATSFKLGAMGQASGTLLGDHVSGVAGRLGAVPATVPITYKVRYTDDQVQRVYHYNAVIHSKFTPLLAGVSLVSSLGGARELPTRNTVDYDITVTFNGGQSLHLVDRAANADPQALMFELTMPLLAAADNPFQKVMPQKVEGQITISSGTRLAQVVNAQTPVRRYQPGDRVKILTTLRHFRGVETVQPIEIDIPRDLPDGSYDLTVSGKQRFVMDRAALEPFQSTATNIGDVFAILNQITQVRSNALYARLSLQPEGLAIGRASLPRLPASMRHVLANSGRSDITAYMTSQTASVATDFVIEGDAQLTLEVDRQARTDTIPRPHPGMPPRMAPPMEPRPIMSPREAPGPSMPAE